MKITWKNHFIELVIVIIGISVAFWLNNLASEQKDRTVEKQLINELIADLQTDSLRLEYHIEFNRQKVKMLEKGIRMILSDKTQQKVDSAVFIAQYNGHYEFFFPENFTLSSMLQSGDIKYLRNQNVKKELLRLQSLYERIKWNQENFLQALDQNYFPTLLNEMDLIHQKPIRSDFLYSPRFRNFTGFVISDTQSHIVAYQHAQNQIGKLITLMQQ